MKKLIFVLAILSIAVFNSCTKDEIDARDKFVGTWQGTSTAIVSDLDLNQVSASQFSISKKSNSNNEIEITTTSEDTTITQIATVNDNAYTYEQFTYSQNSNGITANITTNGGGYINGSVIQESGTLVFNMNGQAYNGTWSSIMNKQ